MFRSLSFVTVRKQKHDSARSLPFRFRRDDELVDDHLGAIGEIAELRFPKAKHVRVIERVAVIEAKDSGFREKAVVNTNPRLSFGEMEQGHIRPPRLRIVDERMAGAECA